jgi:hypothetical protein
MSSRLGQRDPHARHPQPKSLWTNKQLLSMTVPGGINIHQSSDLKPPNPDFDGGILFESGGLILGTAGKKTAGAAQGGRARAVFREKTPKTCSNYPPASSAPPITGCSAITSVAVLVHHS